jgi:hypothetical protein
MKKEQPPEKPMPTKCVVCDATPVEPGPEAVDSDYALCPGHLATLHDSPRQRVVLRQIQEDVQRRRVAIAVDANGVGWFSHLPPAPPPKGVPLIQDDGSPTYRDWDSKAVIGGEGDGTD